MKKNKSTKSTKRTARIPGGKGRLKNELSTALTGQHKNLVTDLLDWILEVSVDHAHAWESKDPQKMVEEAFSIAIHELLPTLARERHTKAAVADMYGSNFGEFIYGAKSMFSRD
jgi:hypothetical protein